MGYRRFVPTVMETDIGLRVPMALVADDVEHLTRVRSPLLGVAEHFKIRVSDMSSARRSRAVARPRQVAMYLSKQLTSRSLPEIGRAFGGRDHTTVMHAVKKVDELRDRDASFAEDVELLRRMLEG